MGCPSSVTVVPQNGFASAEVWKKGGEALSR